MGNTNKEFRTSKLFNEYEKFNKDSFVKVRNNIRKIDDNLLVINSMVWSGTHSLNGFNEHLKFTLNKLELILTDFQNIKSHYISR